uniref:NADH dehydrogenase subunit 5 n=1 Tax=Phoneutria boliviensis TaxID=2598454 RepID=UPI001D1240B4|nr:NADH dehydrogenase subunit 5 [Phoneutria boliviensis]UBY46226.1 NADH dehydrogenase subunit 5 [Phoneutria boliviensis]
MLLSSIITMMISITSFTMSMTLFSKNTFIYINIPMLKLMQINLPISMILDWISCMFMSTVMMISSMILMFSMYYIPKKEHKQFSLMLIMFVLSMSILILSNNMFLMLLGWDMLGMSSYILVIFYQNHSSSGSGSITLLSNRIGDIFILLSISMMMSQSMWELNTNHSFTLATLTMLMIASCTKSAQFPFSAWLPMAMSAPTPISALVHSSTLVTAGIFLMIRITSNNHPLLLLMLMTISSMTAIYAGMSANWEQDMKKIIALSTLSQMAMMMFAISITSTSLAYFHMITHAFFKSLMFMCAGVLIHESSYQDMRTMSTNHFNIPLTLSTLSITNMTLMGLPFTSGYFSKDMIIEKLISSKMECTLTLMMISSIGMTASYSLRMMLLSNKMTLKYNADSQNHSNYLSNLPIMLMMPTTILLGSSLLWMINPEQMLLFPNNFKTTIMLTMIMGTLIGSMLSFKSLSYKLLGQSAISLWFIHFMSTKSMLILSPLMKWYSMNDKNWQELYGPTNLFKTTKKSSFMPEMTKSSLLMMMIMLSLIPLTLT